MPIKIQRGLPAKSVLESENIFVMDEDRALSQDIRPLEILILNLMPIKEDTETQLLRALSNTPLQVDCTFLMIASHESKNTSASHLNKFYITFDEVKNSRFDGMIITGAPVENLEYEEVHYWPELTVLARSEEAGVFLVMSRDGKQIFMQGHPEYDRMTLNNEYHRDLKKGLDPELPCNYYENNDPFSMPALTWRNMANTLYSNWLNYYVYQETPYDLYGKA